MRTQQLKLGPMDNFSYVIWNDTEKAAIVIDPAWQPGAIEKHLKENGLVLKALLLTHAHPDHTNAARYFLDRYPGTPLWLHKGDAFMLEDIKTFQELRGDEELAIGGLRIKVIHTPGHTPGSVSYLAEGAVFTGDTLFIGECGRVDLPGSSATALRESLLKLAALPENTTLYPGHSYNGDTSTIGAQKLHNIYIKLALLGEAEFVKAAS